MLHSGMSQNQHSHSTYNQMIYRTRELPVSFDPLFTFCLLAFGRLLESVSKLPLPSSLTTMSILIDSIPPTNVKFEPHESREVTPLLLPAVNKIKQHKQSNYYPRLTGFWKTSERIRFIRHGNTRLAQEVCQKLFNPATLAKRNFPLFSSHTPLHNKF